MPKPENVHTAFPVIDVVDHPVRSNDNLADRGIVELGNNPPRSGKSASRLVLLTRSRPNPMARSDESSEM